MTESRSPAAPAAALQSAMEGRNLHRRADGFLERGHQVTRLEAFVDAAFAFAVTLLVISGNNIPQNAQELVEALRRVPAFGAGFALVAAIWFQHYLWSRRFGLEDRRAILLSLLLVFMVLIYVYPLRALFAALFSWVSRGALPSDFRIDSVATLRLMFVTYGIAFGTLGLLIIALHAHALAQRAVIGLDPFEVHTTRREIMGWTMAPATGLLSVGLALAMRDGWPGWALGMPGMAYCGMIAARPLAKRIAGPPPRV
jgi:hypothetical protein